MKKIIIVIALGLFLLQANASHRFANLLPLNYMAKQESEVEKLMKFFLLLIQNSNPDQDRKFIEENYSAFFLKNVPMEIHMRAISNLRTDYLHHAVVQKTAKDNKITVVIKSPVNKMKQITIETDPKNKSKIFIIDAKDYKGSF